MLELSIVVLLHVASPEYQSSSLLTLMLVATVVTVPISTYSHFHFKCIFLNIATTTSILGLLLSRSSQ